MLTTGLYTLVLTSRRFRVTDAKSLALKVEAMTP